MTVLPSGGSCRSYHSSSRRDNDATTRPCVDFLAGSHHHHSGRTLRTGKVDNLPSACAAHSHHPAGCGLITGSEHQLNVLIREAELGGETSGEVIRRLKAAYVEWQ